MTSTNTPRTLEEYIDLYQQLGIAVIPVDYKTKKASVEWKPYQDKKPTSENYTEWFDGGRPTNIAAVCGKVSRNLSSLDFDKPSVLPEFFDFEKIKKDTFVTQTSRGFQVLLRTEKPIKTQKINGVVEVLSEGHLAMLPPSVHPTGVVYQQVGADKVLEVPDFDNVFWSKAEKLGYYKRRGMSTNLGHITKLPEEIPPCINTLLNGASVGCRNETGWAIAVFLKNQGKPAEEIKSVLYQWNNKNTEPLSAEVFSVEQM